MSEPFFSVIVPEHNAAEYMRKGLDSIRRQTFTDYELIIICDACTDDTEKIASEYSDIVIRVDYASSGKTRNAGLEAATGKWVLFMDDDDWWRGDDAFQIISDAIDLYEELNGNEALDILAFSFQFGDIGYAEQTPENLYTAIWNKAWRRSFIGDTRFPEVPHSDDVGFAEALHPRAKFVMSISNSLYHYNYLRPGSITQRLQTGELKTLEEMGLR